MMLRHQWATNRDLMPKNPFLAVHTKMPFWWCAAYREMVGGPPKWATPTIPVSLGGSAHLGPPWPTNDQQTRLLRQLRGIAPFDHGAMARGVGQGGVPRRAHYCAAGYLSPRRGEVVGGVIAEARLRAK